VVAGDESSLLEGLETQLAHQPGDLRARSPGLLMQANGIPLGGLVIAFSSTGCTSCFGGSPAAPADGLVVFVFGVRDFPSGSCWRGKPAPHPARRSVIGRAG
jgi:hypothetical protein